MRYFRLMVDERVKHRVEPAALSPLQVEDILTGTQGQKQQDDPLFGGGGKSATAIFYRHSSTTNRDGALRRMEQGGRSPSETGNGCEKELCRGRSDFKL
ncbi:hypothetical protein ABEW60_25145 [Paenibacillus jamilae]|uniref:hypothetical protein n=1 Tax=Paenibacillus jamilae TaxID=114136 RepID=UPI003D28B812